MSAYLQTDVYACLFAFNGYNGMVGVEEGWPQSTGVYDGDSGRVATKYRYLQWNGGQVATKTLYAGGH